MQNGLLELVQNKLKERFPEGILEAEMHYDFPVFTLKKELIIPALEFLYNEPELKFNFLTTMCGLHFPHKKGQEFGMMYQLHNMEKNYRIRLKINMSSSDLVVPTATGIFSTANWMEREAYDFFGFIFKGHPNLIRILNMDEMNYFPMRKEYGLEDATRTDKDDTMFGR
jgi:NADH-quinone oxidoreductase subunit C